MLPRLLGGVLALLVSAWFVLAAQQAHDTDRAAALLGTHETISAPTAARVSSLVDAAAVLNPDRTVDILRARVSIARGEYRTAQRRLEQVLADEPQNLLGWLFLAEASPNDRPLYVEALRKARELEPRLPRLP